MDIVRIDIILSTEFVLIDHLSFEVPLVENPMLVYDNYGLWLTEVLLTDYCWSVEVVQVGDHESFDDHYQLNKNHIVLIATYFLRIARNDYHLYEYVLIDNRIDHYLQIDEFPLSEPRYIYSLIAGKLTHYVGFPGIVVPGTVPDSCVEFPCFVERDVDERHDRATSFVPLCGTLAAVGWAH